MSKQLHLIDLYCGCGGLTLGASRAGFLVAAGVDLDERAMEAHKRNFPATKHIVRDIAGLSGADLLASAGLDKNSLDVIAGGPPCQGFSSMGKQNLTDPRNSLLRHYFRIVNETRPRAFVLENVPGIRSEKYRPMLDKAFSGLNGYKFLEPIEIDASQYLAPTKRRRIFFIGVRQDEAAGADTLYDLIFSKMEQGPVVRHALDGLPFDVIGDWGNTTGLRKVTLARVGVFFESVRNRVPPLTGNPYVLKRYFERSLVDGNIGTDHSPQLAERYGSLGYGEQDPISKSQRLDPKGYCPTLRAGTARERGAFQAVRPIHYARPRVITPREAARLQGFPDWFELDKTKWHAFRHIGNSVSPLAGEVVLSAVWEYLAR